MLHQFKVVLDSHSQSLQKFVFLLGHLSIATGISIGLACMKLSGTYLSGHSEQYT